MENEEEPETTNKWSKGRIEPPANGNDTNGKWGRTRTI